MTVAKNYLALLTGVAILAACNNPAEKTGAGKHDSSIAEARAPMPSGNMPEDPDAADTIPASAYPVNTYGKETETLVRQKLQALYKDDLDKNLIDSFGRRFIFYQYDLNGDGSKEIFVGLIGSYFCGTGGCTILLLNDTANVITSFSVTNYPLIIADNKTNGWKDLVLMSGGKYHLVTFNGKKYPSNPSVQPVLTQTPGDALPRVLDFIHEPYAWFKF